MIAAFAVKLLEFGNLLQKNMSKSLGQFKILFTTLQIVSTFVTNFDVPWPDVFVSWVESIQIVNLELFDVASIQCMRPSTDFYSRLVMQVTSPILVSVMLYVVYKLRTAFASAASSLKREAILRVESQHMFAFLFVLFVCYVGVSSTIMRMFQCKEIDGTWWLEAE